MSSALAGIRKSPAAPLLPGHAGHGLVGFQLCGLMIFRSFTRSDFAVSPSNSRQPCASGCGFPCALCIPALSPGFYGGTAPPGAAEHVTMEDSGMSVVAPAVYVGTWHKYNCGSIAGRWFDLTVTNGAIVIHTQRLKSDPGGNLLS